MTLKYNKILVWRISDNCNLNCSFCINKQDPKFAERVINIEKISNFLNDTKDTYHVILTGGEPFIIPNFIELCKEIQKKHYISVYTNLISSNIAEFSEVINPEKVIEVIASMHLVEMKKIRKINTWIKNYRILKNKGFKILCTEAAHPKFKKYIKKYEDIIKKENMKFFFRPYGGIYKGKNYPASHTLEDKKIFNFNDKVINHAYHLRKLCIAGYNVVYINPEGKATSCLGYTKGYNELGNIYEKIIFKNKFLICQMPVCKCNLSKIDDKFYNETMKSRKMRFRLFKENLIGKIILSINYNFPSIYLFINKNILKKHENYLNEDDLRKAIMRNRALITINEAKSLYETAKKINGNIVEIGSYKGGSTIFLAKGLKEQFKIYAIDDHNIISQIKNIKKCLGAEKIPKNSYKSFVKNLKREKVYEKIISITKKSEEAVKEWNDEISFLFIDGNHSYEQVKKDFLLWEPFLKKGGIIALHDSANINIYSEVMKMKFLNMPGPQKVAKEFIIDSGRFRDIKKVDSITYAIKK